MVIGYVRVSSIDQNNARQKEALKKYNIERLYEEKASGKDMERPELKNMLDFVREGDIVVVSDFSRLARNTKDLLSIVEDFNNRAITLISDKENLDSSTPAGKLMITMLGAIYEFERDILLERQREGIAIAKAEGKYKGRKRVKVSDSRFKDLYSRYQNGLITKRQMAEALQISRPTLDKIIKEHAEK